MVTRMTTLHTSLTATTPDRRPSLLQGCEGLQAAAPNPLRVLVERTRQPWTPHQAATPAALR